MVGENFILPYPLYSEINVVCLSVYFSIQASANDIVAKQACAYCLPWDHLFRGTTPPRSLCLSHFSLQKDMKDLKGSWKALKDLEMSGKLLKGIKNSKNVLKFLEGSWYFLKYLVSSWRSWKFLKGLKNSWNILKVSKRTWKFLKSVLEVPERCWKLLRGLENTLKGLECS